ncbi:aromatic acid exporter family protein [Effusibacillus dendaii]|nr:aromatic acid exporter family protein [Effusibacillus dendaii]
MKLVNWFAGARVVKTSIAAGLALYLASFLGYRGYTYAALVAILATQKSLTRSFGVAKYQLASALIGTVGGNLVAWQFGTHPLLVGLLVYLLFAIHLKLKWQNTVFLAIVTAVTSFSSFEGELVIHAIKQIATVVIGISCSVVVNLLSVPRYEQRLDELLERSEGMLRGLLYILADQLSQFEGRFSGQEFASQVKEVRGYIQEARHYAELIFEDHWFYNQKGREAQEAVRRLTQMDALCGHLLNLQEVLEKVDMWVESVPMLQRLIRILIGLQLRVFRRGTAPFRLTDRAIRFLDRSIQSMDLPKTRKEFEIRASLYHFYVELKDYYVALKEISAKNSIR